MQRTAVCLDALWWVLSNHAFQFLKSHRLGVDEIALDPIFGQARLNELLASGDLG